MSRIVVKLAVTVTVALGLVLGASVPSWSYVALKAGVFLPNSADEGLKNYDTGFGGEFAGGANFGEGPVGFGLEGGLGAYRTAASEGDAALAIVPVTLTGKLLIKPGEMVTLYLGAGLGYYIGYDLEGEGSFDERSIKGLGYQAVGGIDVLLGGVGLVAEVKWSQTQAEHKDSDEKYDIGGITVQIGVSF